MIKIWNHEKIDVTPYSASLFSTQNLNYILKELCNAVFSVSLATQKKRIKLKSHNNGKYSSTKKTYRVYIYVAIISSLEFHVTFKFIVNMNIVLSPDIVLWFNFFFGLTKFLNQFEFLLSFISEVWFWIWDKGKIKLNCFENFQTKETFEPQHIHYRLTPLII